MRGKFKAKAYSLKIAANPVEERLVQHGRKVPTLCKKPKPQRAGHPAIAN
jgi:hypothetical protein